MLKKRFKYWHRIFKAYVQGKTSHLSFWHGSPKINPQININSINQYYMLFHKKADYKGEKDHHGVPKLNYQGEIGLQYNPIAISQWGLGNYNIWKDHNSSSNYEKFIKSSDWLVKNLQYNKKGYKVWLHHFDFEYRDTLKSPWYSGLAQGQGISMLVRAYKETGLNKYSEAAHEAFKVFLVSTKDGGVNYLDSNGNNWIEEYIVDPPTHILNGFIWGLWGVYDYAIQFKNNEALEKFNDYTKTLKLELESYDNGFWSLYEHSGTCLKMIASPFYHELHIVQLMVMYTLTSDNYFKKVAEHWGKYLNNSLNRKRAIIQKSIFKVFYY